MRLNVSLIALFGVVCSQGCGPKVTPIGPGFVYQPDEREQRLWATNREQAQTVVTSGAVYDDPKLQEYVQSVLSRVLGHHEAAYLPLRPNVIIIDAPATNAFSLAQGDIVLHTGVLGRIRNEAQLAMLLGHEISHATHRHLYQCSVSRPMRLSARLV
ncbi:MAG: M48 family metalloprotease [Planctomycetes bacterium]|nr:M48 family metalloprotease [Planctomycetota bacterium]